MRLGEILIVKDPMKKILSSDLPIKDAYELSKITEGFFMEVGRIERFRDSLLAKYGELRDGHVHIREETKEEFIEQYNELLAQDYDGENINVELSMLESSGVKLSPVDVRILIEVGIIQAE
jgi:hypothetical protein